MERAELREYIHALAVAVVLAFFLITFVVQSFHVKGRSMEPTLSTGERLLVDKISYRFGLPSFADIVVFRYPADPRRKFVKRIVGLPGDEIAIRGGMVFRNGLPLNEPYILGPTFGPYNSPSFGPVVVPNGQYFLLGDNRRNSDDSRYPDVGFVAEDHIVGRAFVTYWPFGAVKLHQPPMSWRQ